MDIPQDHRLSGIYATWPSSEILQFRPMAIDCCIYASNIPFLKRSHICWISVNSQMLLFHRKCYVGGTTCSSSYFFFTWYFAFSFSANLSESYFTNRQDRYVVLRNCPELADFLVHLVEAVSSFSFQVRADGKIKLHEDMPIHPFNGRLFNGWVSTEK